MANTRSDRLAVLIDADNARPAIVDGLLAEIAKYGTAHVKRIYGDWTGPNLGGWKTALLDHSIQPIQQFAYTSGKNATDSAMIIDAMDLLYAERFDGFCIVSSDSDFTRLAARIRESGLIVYGFGERKTPDPFVAACDKFIYTDILVAKPDEEQPLKPRTAAQLKQLLSARSSTGRFLARAVQLWRKVKGRRHRPHLFDPMAVTVLLHPEWFEWRRGHVSVSLAPGTFARTHFKADSKGPHRVAWGVQAPLAVRTVWSRILAL